MRGTPTDSVIMGVRHLLKDKPPDLVLSGINRGANMAEDVTYSGTIAGAFEGTILGVRSMALSQSYGDAGVKAIKWQTALAHGPALIRKLLAVEWAPSTCMNINFPDREPDDVVGTVVTTQGRRDPGLLAIDERHDTWGNPYYWLAFARRRSATEEGTDLWAVYSGRISVTPLLPRPHASADARDAEGGAGSVGARHSRAARSASAGIQPTKFDGQSLRWIPAHALRSAGMTPPTSRPEPPHPHTIAAYTLSTGTMRDAPERASLWASHDRGLHALNGSLTS